MDLKKLEGDIAKDMLIYKAEWLKVLAYAIAQDAAIKRMVRIAQFHNTDCEMGVGYAIEFKESMADLVALVGPQ